MWVARMWDKVREGTGGVMAISPWACVPMMMIWRVSTVVNLRWVHTHHASVILTANWTSVPILRWWPWQRVKGWSLHICGWQHCLVNASSVSGRDGRRHEK